MKKLKNLLMIGLLAPAMGAAAQTAAAHFDMSLTGDGNIVESVTQSAYRVTSQLPASALQGLDGQALRFDGYSNYVKAGLPVNSFSSESLTVSITLAAETYPMMLTDVAETTPTYTAVCGNIDENNKQGFAFELSSQGDLRFRFGSATGFMLAIDGTQKLPRGQWCQLTATIDKANNVATLYLNGESIGTARMQRQPMAHSTADFYIGKDATEKKWGPFLINTFCGLIDDIAVYNEVWASDKVKVNGEQVAAAAKADFHYPAERYAESLWRPQFHGMPSGGWTNETHGMLYSDGRYHLFFQKNANGPYMSRLHWGHISSNNLYDWREDPIAVYPGESYDIKGCWSGCTYTDASGTPYLLYTAVDNAKARIAQAKATNATLADWTKEGVVIDGRPAGLSDDFRDPYYFEANGNQYIIVGTSKNGVGACTLHKLQNGSWTNDGTIFFQGTSASQHGTFWEMPNVTKMGDKWLFTCTPLGMAGGVRTICWVGTIGTDGKFTSDGNGVQTLEMGGISREGYGLLSPTILPSDVSPLTTNLLIGIVPDKLPTEQNYNMGWAHNYSLPREVSLDANGQLVQRPYSRLTAMRTETSVSKELTLNGTEHLLDGRQLELLGEFTVVAGAKMGFRLLSEATLEYDADQCTLTLDLTALSRTANDNGVYNGIYRTTLPERVAEGGVLKLHVFLDGSIADIFVNDRWAYSVRLFPTDAAQIQAAVYATANVAAKVSAWQLDAKRSTGITLPTADRQQDGRCYDLQGRSVEKPLQKGLYIQNGRKFIVK